GKIMESPFAGFAFQPGAVTPHAKGPFRIANGLTSFESAPKGIKSHFAKGRLRNVHGKNEGAAGAQEPVSVGQKPVIGFGRPPIQLVRIRFGVMNRQTGNDAVEAAGLPAS